MQSDLTALFKSNGVPTSVINVLCTAGCNSLKMFANWVENKAELQASVLDGTSDSTNKTALASLKQAWREAEALTARGVKRGVEGLSEEGLEDALPDHLQKQLEKTFADKYCWDLESRFQGCDSLLGRCKREADRQAPSMLSAYRVRSLAHATRVGQPTKHRLADFVSIHLDDTTTATAEDNQSDKLRVRLYQYQVLCNTWAMVGTAEVDINGTCVIWCPWPMACSYVQHLRDRCEHLLDRFNEETVIEYMVRTEEEQRSKAIEIVRRRTDKMSWGHALIHVQKEFAHLWQDHKDLLSLKRNQGSGPSSPSRPQKGSTLTKAMPPPPAPTQARSKAKSAPPTRQPGWFTCAMIGTVKACKKFNDTRGCDKRCLAGDAHACDIMLLATSNACGSKNHNRQQHEQTKHGAAKPRP